MADDLSSAPATGGSEPAPATDNPAQGNGAGSDTPAARPSLRESLAKAAATVSERDQGAAVLRDGAGADDKLVSDAEKAARASARGEKSWETRRANAEAAKEREAEEAKNKALGKTIAEAVKPVVESGKEVDKLPREQGANHTDAPARMSNEAKAEWANTPQAVRAEIHRAISEMESGISKHKEGNDRWTELAEFDAMAKRHGTTIKTALQNYINADQAIAKDPVKGIEAVLATHGIKLEDFAEHVLDRAAGVASTGNDPIIMELRQQVADLKGELGNYKNTQHKTARERIDADVAEFTQSHPRVADPDFEAEMSFFITTGKAKTLQQAYDLAERLIPAAKAPAVADPDPAAQNRKANLSPTGAPGAGSDPAGAGRPKSKSIREAIVRASQRVG